MEKKIDWSKAPECATHVAEVNSARVCWYKIITNEKYFYAYQNDGHFCQAWGVSFGKPGHGPLIGRPAQIWTGEGLPPVGTVCEIHDNDPHPHYRKHVGQQVEILAHTTSVEGGSVAVYKVDIRGSSEYHGLVASCFKPIKTAEQIAADERLHQIRNALTAIKGGDQRFPNDIVRGNIVAATVEAMIDAGYRKQVQP